MNNLKITLSLTLLLFSSSFFAQNYNDLINEGRSFLRIQNYTEASKSFIAAGILTSPRNWVEIQNELNNVYTAIEARQRELTQATRDLETTKRNLVNVTNERDELKKKLTQATQDLAKVNGNLGTATNQIEKLQDSLNVCSGKLGLHNDLQAKIALQNEFIEFLPNMTDIFLEKVYDELKFEKPEETSYEQHIANMFIKADLDEKKVIIEAIKKVLPPTEPPK